jgi:VanZ family protein
VLRPQHYFTVWLVCTLYGAFDEISQTPFGRSCDGLDWLADIVGIIAGLTLYRLVRPLVSRRA